MENNIKNIVQNVAAHNLSVEEAVKKIQSLTTPSFSDDLALKNRDNDTVESLKDALFNLANRFAILNEGGTAVKLHSIHNNINPPIRNGKEDRNI